MKLQGDIFNHLFQLNEGEEWQAGVELYQEQMIGPLQHGDDLVTGSIGDTRGGTYKVSIKAHPTRRFIQWVECSCQLNRRYGSYCRHLTACFLQLVVNKSPLVNALDTSSSPFPPPGGIRGTRKRQPPLPFKEALPSEASSAGETGFLSFLEGSIKNASLVGKGPQIKLLVEIGSHTRHEKEHLLSIDEAAYFLKKHGDLVKKSTALKSLRVFDEPAFFLTTHLFAEAGERLVAERLMATYHVPSDENFTVEDKAKLQTAGPHIMLHAKKEQAHEKLWSLPYKSLENRIGKKYFFIPQLGYFAFDDSTVNPSWFDLASRKVFLNDQAGELIQSGYKEFVEAGAVCLGRDLPTDGKILEPELVAFSSELSSLDEEAGFFYLAPYYRVGNEDVPMVELLRRSREEKKSFFRSGSSWYVIPEHLSEFPWQIDQGKQKIKATALELTRFKVLHRQAHRKDLQEMFSQADVPALIASNEAAPLPAFDTQTLQLRGYQLAGLRWLWWLYRHGLHGLLADEMGLGKTHQAMALISAIRTQPRQQNEEGTEKKYVLVICPTSVTSHWQNKLNNFLPEVKALNYFGNSRRGQLSSFTRNYEILITSYRLLLHDIRILQEIPWHLVILDEAHYIKNHRTATYKAACSLPSVMRLCLSGTPLENHLSELKNLFDFLVPGYLGSDAYFRKHYRQPIEGNHDKQAEENLQMLIEPLKLRRAKSAVLAELPPKLEELKYCLLSPEQVKLYRQAMQERVSPLLSSLRGGGKPIPYLHVFAVLQLLKQICNHPALVIPEADYRQYQSGKFELFKELLGEALDSGNKVVVFSQYVKMIKIISQYCQEENISCVTMTGNSKNRGQLIERFQTDPSCKVFVCSLLSGGVGIDLTAASTVIHYDRWWNASKEDQATDRVHRIGQEKFVHSLKLVTSGTLEEKIAAMIASKQKLVEKFLSSESAFSNAFSRDELIYLLEN